MVESVPRYLEVVYTFQVSPIFKCQQMLQQPTTFNTARLDHTKHNTKPNFRPPARPNVYLDVHFMEMSAFSDFA